MGHGPWAQGLGIKWLGIKSILYLFLFFGGGGGGGLILVPIICCRGTHIFATKLCQVLDLILFPLTSTLFYSKYKHTFLFLNSSKLSFTFRILFNVPLLLQPNFSQC